MLIFIWYEEQKRKSEVWSLKITSLFLLRTKVLNNCIKIYHSLLLKEYTIFFPFSINRKQNFPLGDYSATIVGRSEENKLPSLMSYISWNASDYCTLVFNTTLNISVNNFINYVTLNGLNLIFNDIL